MNIGNCGTTEGVTFWPTDKIEAAFKRVNAAQGKPEELEELRLFLRTMNYFYEQAAIDDSEMSKDEMDEICRLAKKGLYAELGITAPDESLGQKQ